MNQAKNKPNVDQDEAELLAVLPVTAPVRQQLPAWLSTEPSRDFDECDPF